MGTFNYLNAVDDNVTSFEDDNVTAGTTAYYHIYAHNMLGESVGFAKVSVKTPAAGQIPAGPENATAEVISTDPITVRLSWEYVSDNEAGFKIYAGYSAETATNFVDHIDRNARSVDLSNVAPGKTIHYRIYAYNSSGESQGYAATSVTTPSAQAGFVNNTVYPITSLIIDNVQYINTYADIIPKNGGRRDIPLADGPHTMKATSSFGGTDMYTWGMVTITDGYTFENPTMSWMLCQAKKYADWVGTYLIDNVIRHATFRFKDNNEYVLYDYNGNELSSGRYSRTTYTGTGIVYFKIGNEAGVVEAMMYEPSLQCFLVKNGPAEWQTMEYCKD